jgi:hypothetical protein
MVLLPLRHVSGSPDLAGTEDRHGGGEVLTRSEAVQLGSSDAEDLGSFRRPHQLILRHGRTR